jgi:peptidoglycan hydrolase-like protein with peptidoglycan-binding domain
VSGILVSVLNAARSKLGVSENPPGSNDQEFGAWYSQQYGGNWNGQPWCAMFVNWCLVQGNALDVVHFSYCPAGVAEYQRAGRWGTTPKPGAVVFYQWTEPVPQHVGIVESVNPDGSIIAIEGNTSVSVQDNGGIVMRRQRKVGIVGYGYPVYSPAPITPAPTPVPPSEPVLRYGSTGVAVVLLQHLLDITADGIFGPGTDEAVLAFQRRRGLTPDSVVGPLTWAALTNP